MERRHRTKNLPHLARRQRLYHLLNSAAQQKWGKFLLGLREKRGLSQQEFADLSKINRSTISKIENGKWNFTTEFIELYLTVLDFDVTANDLRSEVKPVSDALL